MQPPPPDDIPRVELVQPAAFNAPHGLQFKVVDDGATVMKALFEYVAIDRQQRSTDPDAISRGVSTEIDRWRVDDTGITDFYLTANAPVCSQSTSATLRPQIQTSPCPVIDSSRSSRSLPIGGERICCSPPPSST